MKPKLIFIYGPIAAGKLTVAQELKKVTRLNILHNHLVIDSVHPLFSKNEHAIFMKYKTREKVFYDIVEGLMQAKESIIMTYAYAKAFTAPSGLTDESFVKKIQKIVVKNEGAFCPVFLVPEEKELYKRVNQVSRNQHRKLTKVKTLRELMKREDMYTPADFKNNFIVDNTNITPKKVAKMIKENFML